MSPVQNRRWEIMDMMKWAGEYLVSKGIRRGRLDAEYLLARALKTKRLALYLRFDQPLEPHELAAFKPLLRRRAAREPLQYVLGTTPFRDLKLAVDPRVAIPRPETEQFIDRLVEEAGAQVPFESALDIGTGSGAIAITLASEGLAKSVTATDISEEALEVARANAETCGRPDIRFRRGWGTDAVAGETFDLIMSNPPYLTEEQWRRTAPEVRRWEPHQAMVGGARGLAVMKRFARRLRYFLRPNGWLGFEFGRGQEDAARSIVLVSLLGKASPKVLEDLTGTPRYVFAQRNADPIPDETADA